MKNKSQNLNNKWKTFESKLYKLYFITNIRKKHSITKIAKLRREVIVFFVNGEYQEKMLENFFL